VLAAGLVVAGSARADETWSSLDAVLVGVEGTVITESEVRAEARLLLLRTQGLDSARRAALSGPFLRVVLRGAVERELFVAEARRLRLRAPEQREAERELDRIAALIGLDPSGEVLAGLGFPMEPGSERRFPLGLEALVKSELFAALFLEERAASTIVPDPRDVERCLAAQAGRLVGLAPTEARRVVEAQIRNTLVDRGRRALLTQLARRGEVRVRPGLDLEIGATPPPDPSALACAVDEGRRGP